jgi:outer membrane protein insertion porin family
MWVESSHARPSFFSPGGRYFAYTRLHRQSMSNSKLHVQTLEQIGTAMLFLVFMAAVSAGAQLSSTSTQSIYEGQTLTAVELIANPHRDVESLRSLLVQQAGQPLSEENISASIYALEKQGNCKGVKVEVISNPSGLQLNFILEPPYYVGIVEFPELARHFNYGQLLKVVNFSDEEPYNKARLPLAEAALKHFLQNDGYFEARAHAEPKIDDANQLVNVKFSVQLGERARIRNVEVQGIPEQESLKLVHTLASTRARFTGAQLKGGKSYTSDRHKAATALLKKSLARQHRLASKVEGLTQHHANSNLVDIFFRVEPGPLVDVRVTGARLSLIPFVSRREIKKLLPIYSERTIDPDLVKEGQINLIDYFKRKGFYDVEVHTDSQVSPEKISILYEVSRGKKHKVDHILFSGAHQISEKDLLSQVVVKKSRALSHGRISQRLLKQSEDNLQALYNDRGYEAVKIASQVTERESKIDVVFEIEEGPQTLVEDVQVTGNDHVPESELAAPKGFQLRPGLPFSNRRMSEDRSRISAAYLNRGYLNAEVNAIVKRHADDPHDVDITYGVTERQMVHVSQVAYLGQQRTRVSMLEKTAQIASEGPMKRGDLLQAESRLYDLNIFDWSTVGPKRPITDQTDEAGLVRVHESKRNEISYGFGFDVTHRGGNVPSGSVAVPGLPPVDLEGHEIAPSQATYAGPRGSIQFSRRNMRGLGETASALLLFSRLDQQAGATYTQPHFLSSKWSSLTSLNLERTTENPLYAANLGNASFQLERLIDRKTNTRLQLRYNANKTNLSDLLVPELVLPQDRNVRLFTISGTLIRDSRDKPLDAHRGVFSTLNVELTPTALGSSATFVKFFGQYAFYKPVHSMVFANSVRLGLAKALAGSFVPTSELFFSGGGTSLRSFPINQAGPQRIVPFCNVLEGESGCVDVTVPVGGRQLFILNSELRFPLGIKKALGGVIFYDGGNVYRAISLNDFVRNYTNTVGFGFRYATPIGPVRIDVGHNLNPVPGINPTQYYITLGQAF